MKKYRFTLLAVLVAMLAAVHTLRAQSGCYVRLADASGYTPTAGQLDALEQTAAALCAVFDSAGFGGQFKVYDFGFYQHHETTTGAYPEPFARKVAEVAALSPYYLLFGKQSDSIGVYRRFWVDVRLPDSLCFSGMDPASLSTLQVSLRLTANQKDKTPGDYHKAEQRVMEKLRAEVSNLRACCYFRQDSALCTVSCLTAAEIRQYLTAEKGYFPIPIEIIDIPAGKSGADLQKYSTLVEDYAEKWIKFIEIQDLTEDINISEAIINEVSIAVTDDVAAKGFITKNENFCNQIISEKILSDFSGLGLEAFIHIHLWENPDTTKPDQMLVKFNEKTLEFEIELQEVEITAQSNICGPLPLPQVGVCCPTYAITQDDQGVYHGYTGVAGNWTKSDSVEYYRRSPFDEVVERENFWGDRSGANILPLPPPVGGLTFTPSFKAWCMANHKGVFPNWYLEKELHFFLTKGVGLITERKQIFQQFKYANFDPPAQNNKGTSLNWDCTSRVSHSLYNKSSAIATSIQTIESIFIDWLENHQDFDSLFLDRNRFSFQMLPNPSLWDFFPLWAFQAFGGTQGIMIEVRSLKSFLNPCYGYPTGRRFQCEIYFTIIDNFGVGMSDGEKWFFPGLVEQWVLQHYRNFDCDRPPCYIPITNHTARIYHKFDICLSN